jgi:hypothetical protein
MKIRFIKTVAAEIEDTRYGEFYSKTFYRWTELLVEQLYKVEGIATIRTDDGKFIMGVPADAVEVMEEKKKKLDIL